MSVSFLNIMLLLKVLPFRAFNQCGLDLDRLFPLPRRAKAILNVKLQGWRYIAHCRKSLGRVRAIHRIRCGPLATTAPASLGPEAELRPYGFRADLQRAG
jgi:hypothetical protein